MFTVHQVIIILIILVLLYIITLPAKYTVVEKIIGNSYDPETFDDFWYRPYGLNMYTEWLFWNTPEGSTRNMSYDLRGDIPIPKTYVGPWLNSSRAGPIINRPLMADN